VIIVNSDNMHGEKLKIRLFHAISQDLCSDQ